MDIDCESFLGGFAIDLRLGFYCADFYMSGACTSFLAENEARRSAGNIFCDIVRKIKDLAFSKRPIWM